MALMTRSRQMFHWRSEVGSIKSLTNVDPVTSIPAVALADSLGTSWSSVAGQPSWYWVSSVEEGGAVLPSLFLGTTHSWYYPFSALPQDMTLYVKYYSLSNHASATGSFGIAYIGNAGNTGARFWVQHTTGSNGVTASHHNGTSSVTASVTTNFNTNNLVELRVQLSATGVVTLGLTLNAGAESTASTGTLALAGAWSDTRLWLNSLGSGSQGANAFRTVKLAKGQRTLAEMRRLF